MFIETRRHMENNSDLCLPRLDEAFLASLFSWHIISQIGINFRNIRENTITPRENVTKSLNGVNKLARLILYAHQWLNQDQEMIIFNIKR